MTQTHEGVNGTGRKVVLDRLTPPPRVRVLVAHAGTRATVGSVVRQVAEAMRAHRLDVDVVPARSVRDVQAYDAVLVGSAVVRRRWHRQARRFVRRHGEALAIRPVWLFSCLDPAEGRPRAGRVRGIRRAQARIEARGHEVFAPSQVAAVSRWSDRVGGSIAWEHHVRRDVIRGTAV